MTDTDTPTGNRAWNRLKCVSCGTLFKIAERPSYCPGCGREHDEADELSIAERDPAITAFKRMPLGQVVERGADDD